MNLFVNFKCIRLVVWKIWIGYAWREPCTIQCIWYNHAWLEVWWWYMYFTFPWDKVSDCHHLLQDKEPDVSQIEWKLLWMMRERHAWPTIYLWTAGKVEAGIRAIWDTCVNHLPQLQNPPGFKSLSPVAQWCFTNWNFVYLGTAGKVEAGITAIWEIHIWTISHDCQIHLWFKSL